MARTIFYSLTLSCRRSRRNGDGRYGDALGYLEALASRNPPFHVTFEHRAELAGQEELGAIYERAALSLSRAAGHTDTPCRNILRVERTLSEGGG